MSAVESGLTALRTAFANATNPQVPSSAGKGLPSFGPAVVAQLAGALGVTASFAKSPGVGVVGPAATVVATSVYDAYLKTSIATGFGFSTGYAGFSERSLYDVGDLTASGFHALVSGPAIEQAVACGQASAACASVEDRLLAPVLQAGLGTTAVISVTQGQADLQAADPALATMLSRQYLNVTLSPDGSLTLPAGGYDAMLTRAGTLNQSLVTSNSAAIQSLVAAAGDPASPHDVSGQAATDLTGALPVFDFTLTGTLFSHGIRDLASPNDGAAKDKRLLDGSALAQDTTILMKAVGLNNSTFDTEFADTLGIVLDVVTEQWGDAIKNLFGIIGALTASPAKDEALILAQQTDQMIQQVFTALTQDLNEIEKSIQNVEATLNDMFNAILQGFADIDFQNGQILAGLNGVEFTLGQLQYQTDLTDGDVVAFGQGQIQAAVQGMINQCLDRAARNPAALDFAEFSDCSAQFKTEALTDASNGVVEFATPPPSVAPGNGDFSADGTVATTLAAHGTNQAENLAYLLGVLRRWYGIGTDPATLSPPLVNPAVWAEVALGYRELLDEYPQFSAGAEPDLAAIEGPGQQVVQLIGAIHQVDTTTWTNPAVQSLNGNYLGAFTKLVADIGAHHASFLANATGQAGGYGTPSGKSWVGYNPFPGTNQAVPSGDDPQQTVSTLPSCQNSNTVGLGTAMPWEGGASPSCPPR